MSLIRAEGLIVRHGARVAVGPLDLDVAAGQVVAVLGANGAGKSSLLRAVAGVAPCAGALNVAGVDPRRAPPAQRARRLAYLPQNPSLAWPLTVRETVALGRLARGRTIERFDAADHAAVDRAIAAACLEGFEDRRMDAVSGGERARALLARALAVAAPALALDEPTAALDLRLRLAVAAMLRTEAARGVAVLVATHDMTLAAAFADAAILLREGRVVAAGPPEVALTPETIRDAFGVEARVETRDGALTITPRIGL